MDQATLKPYPPAPFACSLALHPQPLGLPMRLLCLLSQHQDLQKRHPGQWMR
jgi:hypothetical protein